MIKLTLATRCLTTAAMLANARPLGLLAGRCSAQQGRTTPNGGAMWSRVRCIHCLCLIGSTGTNPRSENVVPSRCSREVRTVRRSSVSFGRVTSSSHHASRRELIRLNAFSSSPRSSLPCPCKIQNTFRVLEPRATLIHSLCGRQWPFSCFATSSSTVDTVANLV